jgi:hypothetical protein
MCWYCDNEASVKLRPAAAAADDARYDTLHVAMVNGEHLDIFVKDAATGVKWCKFLLANKLADSATVSKTSNPTVCSDELHTIYAQCKKIMWQRRADAKLELNACDFALEWLNELDQDC